MGLSIRSKRFYGATDVDDKFVGGYKADAVLVFGPKKLPCLLALVVIY